MRRFITWLYRKLVFEPTLREMDPQKQYGYLISHGVDLCSDTDILVNALEVHFSAYVEPKPPHLTVVK